MAYITLVDIYVLSSSLTKYNSNNISNSIEILYNIYIVCKNEKRKRKRGYKIKKEILL